MDDAVGLEARQHPRLATNPQEKTEGGISHRVRYARWMLRDILLDPEY